MAVAPKGVKNSALVGLAKRAGRILLTNDTAFLSTALYPPADSPGRIVLRVFPDSFADQRDSLSRLLATVTEASCAGELIELRRDGFDVKTK